MWSGRTQEDLQQLLRRITEVRFFEVGGPVEGTLTEHFPAMDAGQAVTGFHPANE